MSKDKKAGGLAGVSAGETAICTVGKEGAGLTYRGYDIYDLAEHARFEEVAYLLHYGRLPSQAEFDAYVKRLQGLRALPEPLKAALETIPGDSHPMDVLRTGCSLLGNLEPEGDFSAQLDVADAAALKTVGPAGGCAFFFAFFALF
jgi:2-methylcitrate synthase